MQAINENRSSRKIRLLCFFFKEIREKSDTASRCIELEIIMRTLFRVAIVAFSFAAFDAYAACQQTQSLEGKKFVCADGTVQLIALRGEEVVIKTYSPESRSWSEQRFPAIDGVSLEQISIAVQSSG